ncbi:hypothetical protein IW261DRAFT_1343114, partial [Armillaria novae-zelandiae]
CSRCQSIYYCSKAHIAQDWPSHKAYCKRPMMTPSAPLTNKPLATSAGTNTFDAILFGVNETKPRLIKIPLSYGPIDEDEVGGMWQKLETKPYPRCYYVQTLGFDAPSLGYTLGLWIDDDFVVNESPLNRCIQTVTRGKATYHWSGNVFALRVQGLNQDFYEDAVMEEDLASLIPHFEDYNRE